MYTLPEHLLLLGLLQGATSRSFFGDPGIAVERRETVEDQLFGEAAWLSGNQQSWSLSKSEITGPREIEGSNPGKAAFRRVLVGITNLGRKAFPPLVRSLGGHMFLRPLRTKGADQLSVA
ncbi:hypothetical protein B0H11DRAFT_2384651 [Mycena galericulata]|nr:hypothetical protein B0H11DRAFT_2384651 [Mycena galericulata]